MYSKNDYRYYLEHRLMESNDFLAHYGVKGMKWKKRNPTIELAQKRGEELTKYYKGGERIEYGRGKYGVQITNNATRAREFKPKRTQNVGTDTNSLKTRIKDKVRRTKLKKDVNNSNKKQKGYVGPARQSKRDQTRDQQAKQAAKELAKERSNVTYNSDGTITFKNTKKRKKK